PSARTDSLSPGGRGLGRGGGNRRTTHRLKYHRQHLFSIEQYLVIPEPQYPKALTSEPSVTLRKGEPLPLCTGGASRFEAFQDRSAYTFPSRKSWANRCSTPPASYTVTSSSLSRRQVTGTSSRSPLRRLTIRVSSAPGARWPMTS